MKYKILRNFYLMNVGRWYFAGSVISEDDPGWKYIAADLKELYEPVQEVAEDAKKERKRKDKTESESSTDNPG